MRERTRMGSPHRRDDRCPFSATSAAPSASSASKLFLVLFMLVLASPAWAACTGVVAGDGTRLWRAAAGDGTVSISFLGHASFLIESPGGVRIVTDYNDLIRAPMTPDIVTMNIAHTTHWTDNIEPGVKFVLRGWDPGGGLAQAQRSNTATCGCTTCRPTSAISARPGTTATRSSCSTRAGCASPISAICTTR